MATWYKAAGSGELMFGIGPAVTSAKLDRSIDLVKDASGTHLSAGSFVGAKGKALGLMVAFGYEMPLSSTTGLAFQLGARLAKVGQINYELPPIDEAPGETNRVVGEVEQGTPPVQTVYINEAIGKRLALDMSGGFATVTYRMYFKPTTKWRKYQ